MQMELQQEQVPQTKGTQQLIQKLEMELSIYNDYAQDSVSFVKHSGRTSIGFNSGCYCHYKKQMAL